MSACDDIYTQGCDCGTCPACVYWAEREFDADVPTQVIGHETDAELAPFAPFGVRP
jgi:hypothetical protein